jgi:predicted deacetylase
MKPSLPIAFHDISSKTLKSIQVVWKDIQKAGVQNITWALIPNHDGLGFSSQLTEFVTQQKLAGDEFYLHGFQHKSNLDTPRNLVGQLIQKITNNEAEFSGLNLESTNSLIGKGLELWPSKVLGTPNGFVAPTWHANSFLKQAVISHGILTYEERFNINSLINTQKKKHFCLPLSFAGIPGGISLWKKALKLLLTLKIPFRLVLHPHDFATPTQKEHTLELIRTLSAIYALKPQRDFLS